MATCSFYRVPYANGAIPKHSPSSKLRALPGGGLVAGFSARGRRAERPAAAGFSAEKRLFAGFSIVGKRGKRLLAGFSAEKLLLAGFRQEGKRKRLVAGSRFPKPAPRFEFGARAAYISAPAADSYFSEEEERLWSSNPTVATEHENLITWGLLANLVMKEKLRLAISIAALLGSTFCTLSMPLFSGRFFETLIGTGPEPLGILLSKLGVLYFLEPTLTVLFVTNMIIIWERVMANLRSQVFRRVLIQKVEFFDRHKVGELTGLLSSELGSVKDLITENVSRDRGFRAIAETVGTLVILFSLSTQLAPVLGLLMLSVSGLVAFYKRTTKTVFQAYGLSQARINDCASETFAAIRTVRSFNGERKQISMFDEQVLSYQKSGVKLGWLKSTNESWTRVMIYVSLMALYILGGSKVKAGELGVGKMVSFIGYTFTLTFAVQGVVNTFGDVRATLASIDRINSLIAETEVDEALARGLERDTRGEVKTTRECADAMADSLAVVAGSQTLVPATNLNTGGALSNLMSGRSVCELAWLGDIALEDVYFSYPMRPDAEILKGINLALKRGTVTAVVGASGAGKSTIVQLLARFYEPTSGRITLAGEDVRNFDKSEWARALSIVNQEPVLFAMTVAENIAYGLPNEDVLDEEIVEAAKAANAHDFIMSLPLGYKTLVGERGSLLSGGQRQRIAIARALLKNAPLLILDEVFFKHKTAVGKFYTPQPFYSIILQGIICPYDTATSSLDTISERLVQAALNRLMKGRTTLVIAHRLSTVRSADQIAVCENGKVVELGTHSFLLSKGGVYASFIGSQMVAFE